MHGETETKDNTKEKKAPIFSIFFRLKLRLRFVAPLSQMLSHVPVYSPEKMVHMLGPQPSGDGLCK